MIRTTEDSVKVRRLNPCMFKYSHGVVHDDLLMFTKDVGHLRDEMIYTLAAKIYAENAGTFKYPTFATKWDHFKHAVFPKWLLKRYPSKQDWHIVTFKALFPEYCPPDKFGRMVEFYELGELGELGDLPND